MYAPKGFASSKQMMQDALDMHILFHSYIRCLFFRPKLNDTEHEKI